MKPVRIAITQVQYQLLIRLIEDTVDGGCDALSLCNEHTVKCLERIKAVEVRDGMVYLTDFGRCLGTNLSTVV